jgi:FtsZ-binding cell division protein ZapB
MSIPVNEERDSDRILGRAIDALAASEQRAQELDKDLASAAEEIEAYRNRAEASEQRAAHWEEEARHWRERYEAFSVTRKERP